METTPGKAQPTRRPRLAADAVCVRFGGIQALDDVRLDVGAGEIVGLMGPNGAGKSTLFAVFSGLLAPTSGRVLMNDRDTTTLSAQARARRGLARTFQHPELFTGLTVGEHLRLAYRMDARRSRLWTDLLTGRGFRRGDQVEDERMDELVETFGLQRIVGRTVRGLPLGQTRIVELARSIATSPKVLLLDEPSSGLDVTERVAVSVIIRDLVKRQDVSVLLVEHDIDFVLGLSDRVYVLDFGRIIASGTPARIRTDSTVKAAYLGEDVEAVQG
jgi:branched-chain amino acid transport system ATP-binding protein